jgi:predicted transposase/invertase (TIGR01784 family)
MARKYLDPKADLTFKKVFGEHKNLMISFLNALLPLDKGKQVESIEYLPPEMVPDNPDKKNSIVDVRCEETGGRKFIVEMQLNWTTAFKERVLFNAAKAYVRQIDRSEKYKLLQPVYSLNLVNKVFEPDTENCYHHYSMVHSLDTKKQIDGLHLVFVELPKFKPQSFAEKKMAVLWLKFLTEIDEKTRAAPQELLDNPEVAQALEIMEVAAYSDAELAAYDGYWDAVRIEATIMGELNDARADLLDAQAKVVEATAARDALATERDAANARADAATEKLCQTARNLKAMNLTTEQIAAATGLTAEEIAAL